MNTYRKSSVKATVVILLILLVYYKFLYLLPLPGNYGKIDNDLLFIAITFIAGIYFVVLPRTTLLNRFCFNKYIFSFFAFLLIQLLYTTIKYPDEKFTDSLKEILTFFSLFSYYIFSWYAKKDYQKLLKLLFYFSSIVALLFLMQALTYSFNQTVFLKINGFSYGDIKIVNRLSGIRLLAIPMIDFSAYLAIGTFFSKNISTKTKKASALCISSVFFYNIIVTQTRSTLAIFSLLFIIFLFISNRRTPIIQFFITVLAIFGFLFLVFKLQEMFKNYNTDYSIYHRADAINFYLNRFFDAPLFGNGLLRDTPTNIKNYYLVHGMQKNGFSYNDVGLLGFIGHYGLSGFIIYLLLLINIFNYIKLNHKMNPIIFCIFITILFSLINLSVLDAGRISVLAIYLSIIEGIVYESKKIPVTKCSA